jgi:hypothetical protein
MIKVEKIKVWGFEHAIRGMRNPMNSWDKSDSEVAFHMVENFAPDDPMAEKYREWNDNYGLNIKIGKNDLDLMRRLIKAGSEHRKFMRQIFVSVDITAPLYWWSEFDTYKVGTVANSTSKMHKIATTPITKECFEMDDFNKIEFGLGEIINPQMIIDYCEKLRQKYLETKDKKYWKELIRWLPESWLQTRTVTMNYENLLNICSKGQRRFHKLTEWSVSFIKWARQLPYAQELIFLDELG